MMRSMFVSILLISFHVTGMGGIHVVTNSGLTFSPPSITIPLGDTVRFSITAMHNSVQVSKTTWDANGTTSNGGFVVPFGGGDVVPADSGTYFYVCQAHAFFGMKGMIKVFSTAVLPDTLVAGSFVDQDGNIATTTDRLNRNWSLKIYRDSVNSGIVVGSVASGLSLEVDTLSPGTYVAAQSESLEWSNIGISIDGADQQSQSNQRAITLGPGEKHTIIFLNFAQNTIISSGFLFLPDSLFIFPGDTVHFALDFMHTAREVSQTTWLADDTLSNGGFDLPHGGGDVVLSTPGIHYYVCVPHASIGMKGRIVVSAAVPKRVSLGSGWNMISLPVNPSDHAAASVYPTAITHAFAYQGVYAPQLVLAVGAGYWLKFSHAQTVSIIGQVVASDTEKVVRGWNMIGSLSNPVPTNSISSIPPGILTSSYFGYNGVYSRATVIDPGYGYWVKASDSGRIILTSGGGGAFRASHLEDARPAQSGELVVRDAAFNQGSLYVLGKYDYSYPPSSFALPPPPPEGAFDVRFSSGDAMHILGEGPADEFPFEMRSAVYPVAISWTGSSLNRRVSLLIDREQIEFSSGHEVRVQSPSHSLVLKISGSEDSPPADYRLSQAFPNPFNPATVIRYYLPTESSVLVHVYDVLGQEVAVLKNGQVEPKGAGSVTWNAAANGSGVYFVRLDAVAAENAKQFFSQVIKVMLQK